jgi:hypothetical protein
MVRIAPSLQLHEHWSMFSCVTATCTIPTSPSENWEQRWSSAGSAFLLETSELRCLSHFQGSPNHPHPESPIIPISMCPIVFPSHSRAGF